MLALQPCSALPWSGSSRTDGPRMPAKAIDMSAIFGVLRHDSRRVSEEQLQIMAKRISERGPDGIGVHAEDAIGLGLARLQTGTVPEPIGVEDTGRFLVVADARIDNRDQLLGELGLPKSATDTMIIGNAHERWRRGAPRRLLGTFGYAIWDRTERALTLARDHMGVRPLYLARRGSFTAFATDCRSLLALPEIPSEPDERGLFSFFFGELLAADKETTCYSAIKRFPPATVMQLDLDRNETRDEFWVLTAENELSLAGDDEYIEAFRDHFSRAVARCLPPDGVVGSQLSGGLDSSSIALVANDLLRGQGRGPLRSYSAVFPCTPSADESEFSRAVSAHGSLIPWEFSPGELSPLGTVSPLLADAGQLIFAPNLFLGIEACRAAGQHGVRVLLDGTDGDSTVGHGFDHFLNLARSRRWQSFADCLVPFIERFGLGNRFWKKFVVDNYAMPELSRLAAAWRIIPLVLGVNSLGKSLGLSRKNLARTAWNRRSGPGSSFPPLTHLSQDFIDRVHGEELLEDHAMAESAVSDSRRAVQSQILKSGFLPLALETLDHVAAGHGIEHRFPFCDRELIEFCMAIPADLQLRDGWSRWILRKAMHPLLPEAVCWRAGKSDLSAVHKRGLSEYDASRLRGLVENMPERIRGFVDQDHCRSAFDRFIVGKGMTSDFQMLWQVAILDAWLASGERCGR